MRLILCVLICTLSTVTFAKVAYVTCYSKGKLVYSGTGKEAAYDGGTFFFKEKKTNRVIMTNADCIIKL